MSDPGLCLQSQANKTLLEMYRGSRGKQKSPEKPKTWLMLCLPCPQEPFSLLSFPQYPGQLREEQGRSGEFGLGRRGLDAQADSNAGR